MKTLFAILAATALTLSAGAYDAGILYATWGQDGCRISVVGDQITEWEGCTIPDPPTQEQYDAAETMYLAAQQEAADTAAAGVLTAKQKYAEHLVDNGVPVDADMTALEGYMDGMIDAAEIDQAATIEELKVEITALKNAFRAIMRAVIRRYAAAERELKAGGKIK